MHTDVQKWTAGAAGGFRSYRSEPLPIIVLTRKTGLLMDSVMEHLRMFKVTRELFFGGCCQDLVSAAGTRHEKLLSQAFEAAAAAMSHCQAKAAVAVGFSSGR